MTKLTKRQKEILDLIESHLSATGSPPTRAEIAKTMGFRSPNAAEDHLRALARKGVIELVPGTSRGIRLSRAQGLPILTRGNKQPLLSEENIEGHYRLDKQMFGTAIDFLYRVQNSELSSQGILAGDLLAIHQSNSAQLGQWVLLRNHQDITVRRLTEALEAQNPIIEGVLVGVIRNLSSPA